MLRDARVATIVLNYRHTEDTVACLAALQRSTCLDQRFVVVDNDAPGPAHDRLRGAVTAATAPAGDVTVVATGGNLGYAGGNNVGIRRALERRPEFLLLVNPDLRVEPTTVERLLDAARAVPDAGALGPRIVHGDDAGGRRGEARIWFDGGVFDRSRAGATTHLHMGRPEREMPPGPPRDVDYVTGACLLLRADAVRAVGLLPEDYFLYFEETDYNQQLAAAGWRLVVDSRARAVHHKRSSGDLPTPAYTYYMRRNKQLFARRMGLDEAAAVEEFRPVWIDPWRRNVATRAPHWSATFDALVAKAAADAAAGVTGPVDLSAYPVAEDVAPAPAAGAAGSTDETDETDVTDEIAATAATAATAAESLDGLQEEPA
jgi:GT2 family glycosyltransferase